MRCFDPSVTLHHLRDRGAWLGLDFGGMTLAEICERIRAREDEALFPPNAVHEGKTDGTASDR